MIFSSVKSTRDFWMDLMSVKQDAREWIHEEAIRQYHVRKARGAIRTQPLSPRAVVSFRLKCARACRRQIKLDPTKETFWRMNWKMHMDIVKEYNGTKG